MNHSDGFDRTVSDWLHVDAEIMLEGNIHWHQRVRDVDWA